MPRFDRPARRSSRPKAISARQVVVAPRPAVARAPRAAGQVGEGPLEAEARAAHGHVDQPQPGVGGQRLARGAHQLRRPRGAPRPTRGRGDDATVCPAGRAVPEVALPALDPGQAVGVAGSKPRAHVVPAGRRRAPTGPGSRAGRSAGAMVGLRAPGDAPVGALHADAARRTRRGCGSTRRRRRRWRWCTSPPATAAALPPDEPPVGALGLPRVAGDAVELGDADVEPAELAGRRLARRARPRPPRAARPWCECGRQTRSANTRDASVRRPARRPARAP